MDEISWGLSGVVLSLATVISYLAYHIRDLNQTIATIRAAQVLREEAYSKANIKQANDCAREKIEIYTKMNDNERLSAMESKKEIRALLDKDQDLILKVTSALRDLIGERGNGDAADQQ